MSTVAEIIQYWARLMSNGAAFIIDGTTYTYAELAKTMVKPLKMGQPIAFIKEDTLYNQCVQWLHYRYHHNRPIVCHADFSDERIQKIQHTLSPIGIEAEFGVLSSGTTRIPKVLWRKESSWSNFFPLQNDKFNITKGSKLFVHGSLSFTGTMNMVLGVLWTGGTVVTSNHFNVCTWTTMIETYGVSHIYMLPTKLRLLARQCKKILHTVECIIAGSQQPDEQLLERLQRICPSMEFILYYGATELNYITWCTYTEWLDHPNTVGTAVPGVSIEVKDNLIYVNTPYGIENLSLPYTVGDRGYIDDDNYLIFQGRNGDVINRGGNKLWVQTIELAVQELDYVEQVALISIPDALRGEEAVMYVVAFDSSKEDKIEEEIHNRLPLLEWPKEICFIPTMPLTESSKIDKKILKEWYNTK